MTASATNGYTPIAAAAETWHEPRWYALKTRSRHEKHVRDQLLQRRLVWGRAEVHSGHDRGDVGDALPRRHGSRLSPSTAALASVS